MVHDVSHNTLYCFYIHVCLLENYECFMKVFNTLCKLSEFLPEIPRWERASLLLLGITLELTYFFFIYALLEHS